MALTTTFRSKWAKYDRAGGWVDAYFGWMRGAARYEDGQIVMRIDDPYGPTDRYAPKVSDGIEVELSRIHEPEDAVSFVERFGLLTYKVLFPESEYTEGKDTVPNHEIPREAGEPFELFEKTAADLREILHVTKLTRAAGEGDTSAHAALERLTQVWWRREAIPAEAETERIAALAKESDFLPGVTSHVSTRLTTGFEGMRVMTTGPAWPRDPRESPDRITLAFEAPTLRAFCYWSLAQKLIARLPILSCPECSHDFPLEHKRQRFCTRNCARRARYRETQKGVA